MGRKMGYIVPMTNYQSIQYVERNLIASRDPYKYESVNKVKAIKRGSNEGGLQQQMSYGKFFPKETRVKGKSIEEMSGIISEITGKGKYFDISV